MLLDIPFTHWKVYSEKPLARAGCHCYATKTHPVGHEQKHSQETKRKVVEAMATIGRSFR